MKWHFQPRPDDGAERDDDEDAAPGLTGLPAALLERHDARVLHPGHAAVVDGYPTPRPTVYRARTLLVPGDLLGNTDFLAAVNEVLRHTGMELVPPEGEPDEELDTGRGDQEVFERLRRLPRPAVLVPRPGHHRPVVIDAWTALQTLRAATVPDRETGRERESEPEPVTLDKAQVDCIELEHLLTGSTIITGDPISGGHGSISGGAGSSSDTSGIGATDSYLFSGGDPRTPVAVYLDPPWRRPLDTCESEYGRRPVVAVVDTGARVHPWLDVDVVPGGYTTHPDGFVAVDDKIQAAIEKESQRAKNKGDKRRRVIRDAWDRPVADNPLIGELNDAVGHGPFIAGIVRQVAPDARVLAVRATNSDNVLYEGDIICALRHLAKRIALAKPDDLAAEVDVVSLSFGFYSESGPGQKAATGMWHAIEVLLWLGVVVVASAGNDATGRRCYPAAFSLEPVPAGQVPVLSVGALNPDGTKAMFSNDGRWVTAWAVGACVVSTYPTDVNASRSPELAIPAGPGEWTGRAALDPDDFSAGFAIWSGTSFSAPYAAAQVVKALLRGARSESGLKLTVAGTDEKRRRAVAAIDDLPREMP